MLVCQESGVTRRNCKFACSTGAIRDQNQPKLLRLFFLGLGSLTKLRILGLRWCIVDTHPDNKAFVGNLLSSLCKLGRVNLRHICIQSYSIDFLLDSWFAIPHLLQKFTMGMSYHFPRIPDWVASLSNLC
jgi:hypothetical protein